jgi:hypothetical protein
MNRRDGQWAQKRSIFNRYYVSDTDLRLAAQKTETYLQAQMGTVSGTVTKIEKKGGKPSMPKPIPIFVKLVRRSESNRHFRKERGILSPGCWDRQNSDKN